MPDDKRLQTNRGFQDCPTDPPLKAIPAAPLKPLPPGVEPITDVVLAESQPAPPATDVVLAESVTVGAPSFRSPSPVPPAQGPLAPTVKLEDFEKRLNRDKAPAALLPGATIDDFEIVKLLGQGAFGHVYLARQLSLDRLVALKVSANRGSEGRTMARLEHQHIVQVFAEKVDRDLNQRLLCMQLVPGMGLEKIVAKLHPKAASNEARGARSEESDDEESLSAPRSRLHASAWTGAEMLAIIDGATSLPAALDTSALHDREALSRMDGVEATAWFGSRLAEALDFAHRHGVLHRDIKPANILVNSYGRPLLADFNISSQPIGSEPSGDEMFGGTFAYMAPEHLDAFNPTDSTGHDAVTPRSDLYSLGLVLQQLLEGHSRFKTKRKGDLMETLVAMSAERHRGVPICNAGPPGAHMTLDRTIGRCLEPRPEDRFASGAELAAQLDGCRSLRMAERQLPRVPAVLTRVLRHPFLWIILLVLLPQLAGSAVNITYNTTQIVGHLSNEQQRLFMRLVAGYNAIVYPAAIVLFILAVRPVWRCWNKLQRGERVPEVEVESARGRALWLPRWIAGLTAMGWFPGGVIFPLAIAMFTPPLETEMALHFLASFCLSGLIALAYSLSGVEYVVLRSLYPGLWQNVQNFTSKTRKELAPVSAQLGRIELLAFAIPLVAALLTLNLGNESNVFRLMITALIMLGLVGFQITSAVTRNLSRVIVTLTNTKA